MSLKMYDIQGNQITMKDLQNKGEWCSHGERKESVFVRTYGNQLGVVINPEKEQDKYAPDLLSLSSNRLSDLKTQNTPFFTASRYNCDPQHTVTFNKKDADRYKVKYPEIDIYFWVDWIAVRYFKESTNPRYEDTNILVNPTKGVWKVSFKDLFEIIQDAPLHQYQQRIYDKKGNARESYLIDLNNKKITRII